MNDDTIYTNLISTIARKLKFSADKKINTLGLNSQQGRVIQYIYEHQNEGLIQKDLADVFGRATASITSMLKGLEKNGYIRREIPADNERQKNIYVEKKGIDLIETFKTKFIEIEDDLTSSLTEEEKESFLKILHKIDNTLI
ncbi:MAG: MarR family winged helix-turn-helix transcriptional regulator [Clostridium sp.]|uniref:MarR family winged helix-turn-helix transcriptional regulator n=1 Tax=Clostridium sp. TaxID=1506 RepID=UPI003F3ED7E0